MLKAAIVGCGKIADAHVAQIQRIRGCRIVGVCDEEELMAGQLAERFQIERHFDHVGALIDATSPDVVHITTPPQSHFPIALQCLERGCHVYVEKPFTLHAAEAEELMALATRRGLKVTVGHDDQFRHCARRLRQLIRDGYLGGTPVHMESYYCYELAETGAYIRALLGDRNHWVRRLPGQLLHNVISHGVARIAEFLSGERPQVIAHGFSSHVLRRMGEESLVDELRVIVADEQSTTGYFTFSSQMRPSLHQFRIYGPRNGLLLDADNETLIRLPGGRYKSYSEHFLSPLDLAGQYARNSGRNIRMFLARDFHMKAGLKYLIEAFYRSISDAAPVPIPYREILLTARIMDEIFEQLKGPRFSCAQAMPDSGEANGRGSLRLEGAGTAG